MAVLAAAILHKVLLVVVALVVAAVLLALLPVVVVVIGVAAAVMVLVGLPVAAVPYLADKLMVAVAIQASWELAEPAPVERPAVFLDLEVLIPPQAELLGEAY